MAPGTIAADEALVGTASFRGVTIPTTAGGVDLRIETEDPEGNLLVALKHVTLDIGACTITATFVESDAVCVASEVRAGKIGVPVHVQLDSGICTTVRIDWSLEAPEAISGILPDATFDETGAADVFVELGQEGEIIAGTLTVHATAKHPDDENGDGKADLTTILDPVAPTVAFVTPDTSTSTVLGEADDVDPDTAGVQVAITASVDETSDLRLDLDGTEAQTLTAVEAGEATFDAVTIEDGMVVTLTATDACGNVTTEDATFSVVLPGSIAIVTPEGGDTLLAKDDGDAGTTDSYDAVVGVVAPGAEVGATITVSCKPTSADETVEPVVVGSVAVDAISADDSYDVPVAFVAPTLGELSCAAAIDAPAAESDAVVFTVAFPAPTLELATPHDHECFTSKSIGVTGTTTGLVGQDIGYAIAGGASGTVDTVAADGAFTGSIDLPAAAVDGDFTLSFDATDAFGNVVSDTQGATEVTLSLDTADPVLGMTAPATTVGPTGDSNTALPGYQVTVTATLADTHALAGRVCLVVNGGAAACRDVLGPDVSFSDVTLVAGQNTLTLDGNDACGNTAAELTRIVTLTIDNPLVIVSPTDAATLLAAADGDPATARVYETDFRVRADALVVGAKLDVECHGTANPTFVDVGSLTVATVPADHTFTVPVDLDIDVLGTSITCRAKADLPAASTSPEVAIRVGLPAPTLAITVPAANACLVSRSIAVSGTSTSLDGRTVTLSGATGTGTVVGGAWSATGTVLADGPVTLGASATDSFGNSASAATVSVVVDATAPTLALQAPAATIDPDLVPDADPVTPGYQTTVRVAATDAHLVGGQACYSLGGAPTCATLDATGIATFTGVTFQVGDNVVTLSGQDGCGTAAAPSTQTVTLLDNGDLTVAITTPGADLVTAATTLDFTVTVSNESGAVIGATVNLSADGAPTGAVATDNGDGTYRFTGVAIPLGVTTAFVADATLISRSGQSDRRSVTNKDVTPTVTISAPAEGAVLNLASTGCQAGQTPCITTVSATTTNTEDGSAAHLTTTCGASVATADAVVSAGAVSFANVSLAHGGTCTVRVDVTDAVGQGASDTNSVTVDRVAPTVSVVAPGDILDAAGDLSAVDAGIQARLTVDLGGVEAGQVASAVFTWTEAGVPKTKTVTHTVTTDTADGGTYVAAFEETPGSGYVTWPQGFVNVVVTVADLAGNSGSDTQAVAVDVQAGVRITAPTDTATTCSGTCAVGVCNAGACYRSWGVADQRFLVAVVSGLFTTTDNVRVCSDNPTLASAPGAVACATAASSIGPYYQVLLTSSTGGNVTLDLATVLPDGFQHLVVEAQALAGGAWASSEAAATVAERERRVFVDVSAPVVSALGSPSDTRSPVGVLQRAELKGGVAGKYDLRFTASEAAHADIYVNGSIIASQDVPAGATTLTVTLPEGTLQVWVVLRDSANNTSPATPGQGAVTYNVTVDFTLPTLVFTRPNKAILNAGDNRDIVLASDEEGALVRVSDGFFGGQVAVVQVVGGVATLPFSSVPILVNGTHTLSAWVQDAATNQGDAVTSPTTVLVDVTPPAVTINSPADGASLADADDADPGTPGFQVSVSFTGSSGAQDWNLYVANGCDAAGNNCQARGLVASGAFPVGGNVVQSVSLDITGTVSHSKIIVEATDAAANLASADADVTVTIANCQISFTNLPPAGWYNIANACAGGTPCATAQVQVGVSTVGVCPPFSHIDLFNNGSVVGTSIGGSSASFPLTLSDGDHLSLEARAYDLTLGQIASTGVRVRDADFTKPVVSFVSRLVSGFTTAAEGASLTYLGTDDVAPATPGMQFHASLDVADAHAAGGQLTAATATSGSTVNLTPSNLSLPFDLTGASPVRVDLLDLTLADGATYTVVATANDAAGNIDTATFTAAVDITGPPEVPITALTVTRRRPTVKIDFTNVAAASYEIRYSPSPIDATNFASACLATAPELLGSGPAPTPGTAGTPNTGTFGAPDTRPFSDPCKLDIPTEQTGLDDQAWQYWAIRAKDAAGNWSPLGTSSVKAVLNKDVWLNLDSINLDNSTNGWGTINTGLLTLRGSLIGDIDKGGRSDVIIGSSSSQAFCIVRGEALGGELTLTKPVPVAGDAHFGDYTCLTNAQAAAFWAGVPGALSPLNVGHHVANMGDVNGDGIPDFAVSGRVAAAEGFVAIYLGRSGSLPDLTAPNIRIRGPVSAASFNSFCRAGDFDGVAQSTAGGNVFPTDIAVGQSTGGTNMLWIIKGQSSWTTATSLSINLSAPADLTANGVLTFTFNKTSANPGFATRCAPTGDLLPTPSGGGTGTKGDLAVTQGGLNDGRVIIIPGREWSGAPSVAITEVPPTPATGEDLIDIRLRQDSGFTAVTGFATSLVATDLTQDGVPDIVVTHPLPTTAVPGFTAGVYVFDGAKVAAAQAAHVADPVNAPIDVRLVRGAAAAPQHGDTWTTPNGYIISTNVYSNFGAVRPLGDFNSYSSGGNPTVDLVIGIASPSAQTTPVSADIRTNHVGGPTGILLGMFPVVDGFYQNIYPAGTSVGAWVDGGVDLTGDGLPDIIAGSTSGRVIIAH
ncbi:MAG: hypothetical protein U1F43_29905 [Myxococcota bacterium]